MHIAFLYTGSGPIILYEIVQLTPLYVERIKFDTSFMEEKLAIVRHLFEVAVLPVLLGWWFSQPPERISMNDFVSQTDVCASTSTTPT